MKIYTISAILLLMLSTSCKKQETGNQGVIVKDPVENTANTSGSSTAPQEHVYRYLAEDGTAAKVTFSNSDRGNFITVFSNNKGIKAEQTEAWAKGAIYINADVEIRSAGDSLTITQGNQVIELRRAKGQ